MNDVLKRVKQLINEYDYKSARKILDDYRRHNSKDYIGMFYNVKLLMSENKINKAEKEMENLLDYVSLKDNVIKDYMYVTYIYILLEQKKYDLALDYFKKINFDNLTEYSENDIYKLRGIYLFLLKKDNVKTSTYSNQYFLNQQITYNRCNALNHIINRHFNNEYLSTNKVIEVFLTLEDIIPYSIKYPHYDGVDRYIFTYDDLLFEVLTIKHSNEIITMYQVDGFVRCEYINTLMNQRRSVKTKSKQIDKFNKKYNIKG